MKYINIKSKHGIETIDSFTTNNKQEKTEFKRCLNEYKLVYSGTDINVYASQRCTKDWREQC